MVNFMRSVLKILHRAEKIYTGGARGARDKYEVWKQQGEKQGQLTGPVVVFANMKNESYWKARLAKTKIKISLNQSSMHKKLLIVPIIW